MSLDMAHKSHVHCKEINCSNKAFLVPWVICKINMVFGFWGTTSW